MAHELEDLLDCLRDGTAPTFGARSILVDHDGFLSEVNRTLSRIRDSDTLSTVRLLVGLPGSGKTTVLKAVEELAFASDFAVSYVVFDPRSGTLSNPEYLVPEILKRVRTRNSPNRECWEELLRSFAGSLVKKVDSDKSMKSPVDRIRALRTLTLDVFRKHGIEQPSVVSAVVSYVVAIERNDPETIQLVKKWFYGENIDLARLRNIMIDTRINSKTAVAALSSAVSVLKTLGFSGLVLMVDEVERITELWTATQRQRAYETLRQLIDRSLPSVFTLLALTPHILTDRERGIPTYPALNRRVGQLSLTRGANQNPRNLAYVLDPFERKLLVELFEKIQGFHERAYRWSSPLRRHGSRAVDLLVGTNGTMLPGQFVKRAVDLLDRFQIDPSFDPFSETEVPT
jgi:adenylate kinase